MYDFSQVEFAVFLSNVVNLFNDTLSVIYRLPALRFFLAALLLFVVVNLLSLLVRMSQKEKL